MKKLLALSLFMTSPRSLRPSSCPPLHAPRRATDVPPTEVRPPPKLPTAEPPAGDFTLTSERFTEGQPIPEKYTCDDQNVSPALAWTRPPRGTETFALIMDDPDAPGGTWVHWVLYNIPADDDIPARRAARSGRHCLRREPWHQHRGQHLLRGSLPALRHAPLLLQTLRARHRPRLRLQPRCRRVDRRHAGTHPR